LRDLWWNRLGQAVKEERDREPKATTIQITYHDAVQAIEYVSTFIYFLLLLASREREMIRRTTRP
jgi:hypothetical protein